MRYSLIILKKEIRDTLRDRRTLVSMIVMPLLLMPLLVLGMGWFSGYQARQSQEREVRLGVIGGQHAPDLVSFLSDREKLELVPLEAQAVEAVREKVVDAAIVIPDSWTGAIAGQSPITLPVLFSSMRTDSEVVLGRIRAALDSYDLKVIQERLRAKDVDTSVLSTPAVAPQDVATDQERGGFFLSFILPLFLVMWAVMGGMYTAIDASSGEKERKTLETLLASPVPRLQIVVGKLLAVASSAVVAMTLALVSLYVAVSRFGTWGAFSPPSASGGMSLTIGFSGVLVMFGVGVILAVMCAALLLTAGIFAKSYREAQSYVTPVYLLIILPVTVVNVMPGAELAAGLYLVPAANAVLLFKEVLMGTMNAGHILLTMVSLAVFAAIAVVVSVKTFQREAVLFRS